MLFSGVTVWVVGGGAYDAPSMQINLFSGDGDVRHLRCHGAVPYGNKRNDKLLFIGGRAREAFPFEAPPLHIPL